MQIGCWLVISAGCNTVLSFLQHNIKADNIYLKGQLTDNIVKTFLLLEGLGKHYVEQYRRRAMLYAQGHE